jgi:hypothetical protein
VATIGGISGMVWGRLAKVRIVASSPEDTDSWLQDPNTRSKALAVFASTGAKIIVAGKAPPPGSADGWKRIGQSQYYLYALQRSPAF